MVIDGDEKGWDFYFFDVTWKIWASAQFWGFDNQYIQYVWWADEFKRYCRIYDPIKGKWLVYLVETASWNTMKKLPVLSANAVIGSLTKNSSLKCFEGYIPDWHNPMPLNIFHTPQMVPNMCFYPLSNHGFWKVYIIWTEGILSHIFWNQFRIMTTKLHGSWKIGGLWTDFEDRSLGHHLADMLWS